MCFTGTQRRGTIVVFVDIQQILLPLQKTFFSFTWYNKETFYFFFPSTVLEAELAGGEHTHTDTQITYTLHIHIVVSLFSSFCCTANKALRTLLYSKSPFHPGAISRLD